MAEFLKSRSLQEHNISSASAIRIKNDLKYIYNNPMPGIFVLSDSNNLSIIHALITGPFDTPYEGGFFSFKIECTSDYPLKPPKIKYLTTGFGTVRLNPNLYKHGVVCISILDTTTGPGWSPAQNISSVLLSIQSLLNDKPLYNSPHIPNKSFSDLSDKYNIFVQHETLHCAVYDMMKDESNLPEDFKAIIESTFNDYYDYYISVCDKYSYLDGQIMVNPFETEKGIFNFLELRNQLATLKCDLDKKYSLNDKINKDKSAK